MRIKPTNNYLVEVFFDDELILEVERRARRPDSLMRTIMKEARIKARRTFTKSVVRVTKLGNSVTTTTNDIP